MSFSSGATESISLGSKSAPFRGKTNFARVLSVLAGNALYQESDLVVFDQYPHDRERRIEMVGRGRQSDKNFHRIGPLIAHKVRVEVSRRPSRTISDPPRSRADVQHSERVPLRENFIHRI